MLIACSWHQQVIGEKEPYQDRRVSHTICDDCKRKYFPEYVYREADAVCNDMA